MKCSHSFFLLLGVLVSGHSNGADDDGWTELFNGKDLSGWSIHVAKNGSDNQSQTGAEIFTVQDGVMHVYRRAKGGSKQPSAHILHEQTFGGDYILQVEYRWLENRFQPRAKANRDAGILFHVHSDLEKVWPSSIEMQLGDGKPGEQYVTGDLWILGSSNAKAPSEKGFYKAGAPFITGPKENPWWSNLTRVAAEKVRGEWNWAEVRVSGSGKAQFFLNGTLVNEVFAMERKDESGAWTPLHEGQISLQAEWAELEYRSVRVKKK